MLRFTGALLWLLGGLGLATAFALLAPLGWPFELFAHFRLQYLAAALVLAGLLAWRRRAAPAVIALLVAAWHALPGLVAARAVAPTAACAEPSLTVGTVNVQYSNTRPAAFQAWLATRPADLLVIQEVTPAWAAAIDAEAGYPHRYTFAREDAYGIALLSRRPLESLVAVDLAGDGRLSLSGIVDAGGQRVHVLGLHAHWPITPGLAAARDRALQGAARIARAADTPVVLLGDLNLSPHSPAFGRLLEQGELRDVMQGRGWRPTWLAGFWPLALRIDHVLVSPDVCVEHAEVGPPIGSDHRPVVARLRLRARGEATVEAGEP